MCSLLCHADSAQIRICTDRRRKQDRWNGHSDLPCPDTDTPTQGDTTSPRKSSLQTHSIPSQTIPASVTRLLWLATTWVLGHFVCKAKAVGAGFVRGSPVGWLVRMQVSAPRELTGCSTGYAFWREDEQRNPRHTPGDLSPSSPPPCSSLRSIESCVLRRLPAPPEL